MPIKTHEVQNKISSFKAQCPDGEPPGASPGRSDRLLEPGALPVGEVLGPAAQYRPDPVERVVLAAAVAMDLLLDPLPDLVHGPGAELDRGERVEHGRGVPELVIDGVLAAVERNQGRDPGPSRKSPPRPSSPLCRGRDEFRPHRRYVLTSSQENPGRTDHKGESDVRHSCGRRGRHPRRTG